MEKLLGIFVHEVFASLKKRARDNGVPGGKCGSVTFVQRFGSAANLYFQSLVFDGVYACAEEDVVPRFYPLRAPDTTDVAEVATRVAGRVASLLERRDGAMESEEPAMADLYAASITGTLAMGANAGNKVVKGGPFHDEHFQSHGLRCAQVCGFSVHAGVSIRADDRKGLGRLLRYAGRPPIAADRLEQLPNGLLSYRLKTPWKNGTTHMIFEPLEFVARLAVLVPAPRVNLVRYHGLLGPAAKWRAAIIPAFAEDEHESDACKCGECLAGKKQRRRNYSWAALMKRVYEFDVLKCPDCNGRLKILAAIHRPINAQKILECMGLPTRPPPLAPAASQPTFEEF